MENSIQIDGKSYSLVEIENDYWDIFDDQTGDAVNLGCPIPFKPTKPEVAEFVRTGEIKGKIKRFD
jgi:hypothetical protein